MSTSDPKVYSGSLTNILREALEDAVKVMADRLALSGKTICHLEQVIARKHRKNLAYKKAIRELTDQMNLLYEENKRLKGESSE